VVELLSTSLGDDSLGVVLEGRLIGLDGDGDWLLVEGSLKLVNGVGLNIGESGNLSLSLGGVVLALSLLGSVGVVRLELKWVLLDVLEGVVHESTVASHVSEGSRAVDELLLGVGLELSGLHEHSTFDGTGGGE